MLYRGTLGGKNAFLMFLYNSFFVCMYDRKIKLVLQVNIILNYVTSDSGESIVLSFIQVETTVLNSKFLTYYYKFMSLQQLH
jgi:hypothetical protein